MDIQIVTPAYPRRAHSGNRTTAERWARLLAELDHTVAVTQQWRGENVDLLVALHASKSADSIRRFAEAHPHRPLVVALTGTDVYRDLVGSAPARESLDRADALVVLQPGARSEVPARLGDRVHVIHQSVELPAELPEPRDDVFGVAVLAHLREVKDPFLTADAVRRLPPHSRLEVLHCGAPLDPGSAARARAEATANPRWRWLGAQPRATALRVLARCRLLVLTSRLEGGANVISEAAAVGVPVIATRVAGSVGLLGEDYPGYVPVGDADALAAQLRRAESDTDLYAELLKRTTALRPLVEPERERRAWAELLAELR